MKRKTSCTVRNILTSKGITEWMLEDLERGSIALGRKGVPNALRLDLDALKPSSSWIRSVQLFPHIDRILPSSPERDSVGEVLNQWESKLPRYVHHWHHWISTMVSMDHDHRHHTREDVPCASYLWYQTLLKPSNGFGILPKRIRWLSQDRFDAESKITTTDRRLAQDCPVKNT